MRRDPLYAIAAVTAQLSRETSRKVESGRVQNPAIMAGVGDAAIRMQDTERASAPLHRMFADAASMLLAMACSVDVIARQS